MTIKKSCRIDEEYHVRIKIWHDPNGRKRIKVQHDPDNRPIHKQFQLSKETVVRGWVKFLDELAKLPKDKQLFYIAKATEDSIIAKELEKFFSEDELVQLTKFKKKTDIFKVGLEEWV